MEFTTIYKDGTYEIQASEDLENGRVGNGTKWQEFRFAKLVEPCKKLVEKLRKAGANPKDFMGIDGWEERICIRKSAAESFNKVLNESDKRESGKQAKIDAIEGLVELKKLIGEWDRYNYEFEKAMGNEDCLYPTPPKNKLEDLMKKFPVAALYVKAESYSYASHYEKTFAGDKAMELILMGKIEEAEKTLENWLSNPEEAAWR